MLNNYFLARLGALLDQLRRSKSSRSMGALLDQLKRSKNNLFFWPGWELFWIHSVACCAKNSSIGVTNQKCIIRAMPYCLEYF